MRTVAITGGSGFVGSHIAAAFAEAGWRCRLLLRPAALRPAVSAEIVEGSLEQPERLAAFVEGADAVVHAAGLTASRDPAAFDAVNAGGTASVAEAWSTGAPGAPFVLISSLAAREPDLTPYAASKRRAEAVLAGYAGRACVLRPAAVYGPRDAATLALFRMADGPVQPLLGSDTARLCLIHAEDVARAALAAAEEAPAGACWELSDVRREGYGWREMAMTLAEALGRTPRPVALPPWLVDAAGRSAVRWPALTRLTGPLSPEKIRELRHEDWSSRAEDQPPAGLWSPRLDLAEGFGRTVAALRADRKLRRARRASPPRRAAKAGKEA